MNILEINNLTKIYNQGKKNIEVKALDGLDMSVKRGEMLAVMGGSGSGKTTLLNVCSGIDRSSTGEIILAGKNLAEMKADDLAIFRRHHIGMVFQDFNLIDSLNVGENIILPATLDFPEPDVLQARLEQLATAVGIEDILTKEVCQISGGQQQRTAICRALVNQPEIIFADEPTGNLDSKATAAVMDQLTKINRQWGCTVLLVTHDVFAASYCRRIIFLRDGKVAAELQNDSDRQSFLPKILHKLGVVGGTNHEL